MSQSDPDPIACVAGCKRAVADEAAAIVAGWSYVPIQGRWRCPACWLELRSVNLPKEKQ